MKTVAMVPVFNEGQHVIDVLDKITSRVDEILIINDGSSDQSEGLILNWLADKPEVELVSLDRNRGMSAAMRVGYTLLNERVRDRSLRGDDIILKIDADGQHEPGDINRLRKLMVESELQGVRARRRFVKYPRYKQFGNMAMSQAVSVIAGSSYPDVESGFCLLQAKTLSPILDYSTGYRYSLIDEMAVILSRLGYKVSNEPYVDVPYFQSHTRFPDVFINLVMSSVALLRVAFRVKLMRHPELYIVNQVRGRLKRAA